MLPHYAPLKVAEQLNDYDPDYKFFSWIYRIAVNESLNLLRRNRREEELGEQIDLPASKRENPEHKAGEHGTESVLHAASLRL